MHQLTPKQDNTVGKHSFLNSFDYKAASVSGNRGMAGWMSPRASLSVRGIFGVKHCFTEEDGIIRRARHTFLAGVQQPLLTASVCFGEEQCRKQRWGYTYPSHIADAEYSVDDVLINVRRHELHLDGPVAPGGLLRPVLHTELGQGRSERGRGEGGVLVSFIAEPFLIACRTCWLQR